MDKKEKTPFDSFAEHAEKIRKTPISDLDIQIINEISKKIDKEEEQDNQPSDDRQIASRPLDTQI